MCDPVTLTVAAVATTVGAGGYAAYNQYQQGLAQNSYYQYQAEQSRTEGQSAIEAGNKQSNLIQDVAAAEGKQFKTNAAEFNAATRAQLAANGVQGVTASDIVSDNLSQQDLDEMAIRYNADVKSWEVHNEAENKNWALRVQADQEDYAGKEAKRAGKTQAIGTLLSTAASVASIGASSGFGGGAPAKTTTLSTGGKGFSNTAKFKPANLKSLR